MSSTTPQGTTSRGYAPQEHDGADYHLPAPPPPRQKRTGWIVATFAAAALALVGMSAAVFMAFATPATDGASGSIDHHHHSAIVNGGGTSHHQGHHSAQIETLQQELGQLNYYEGPVNGYLTPQTEQAISYLQRDAGLPQTGQMNSATQSALQYMLAHGNNNMAG